MDTPGPFRDILPAEQTTSEFDAQEAYGPNSLGISRRILGAVKPHSHEEVQRCIAVANEKHLSVYPISCGHNWGYGGAVPVTDDVFIMDLSEMRRVLSFDADLGVITVEPGVTQGQLSKFLIQNNHDYLVPVHGGGPECSIMGNALERGYGITPHVDHFAAVTSIRAVLGSGREYTSCLQDMNLDELDKIFKWGIGPYLDGVFSQSAFGVVTQISLVLKRRPDHIEAFYLWIQDRQFEQAADAIRDILHTYGGVITPVNLLNSRRVLSMLDPEKGASNADLLSQENVTVLEKKYRLSAWIGFGGIFGSKGVVRAVKRDLRRKLSHCCQRVLFVSSLKLSIAERLFNTVPILRKSRLMPAINGIRAAFEIFSGYPNYVAMPLAYRDTESFLRGSRNPDRDDCGLLWYSPLIPARSRDLRCFVKNAQQICLEHDINPQFTFTMLSPTFLDCTLPIVFEKNDPTRVAMARSCFESLFCSLREKGYVPYRYGIDQMHLITQEPDSYWDAVRAVKKALDPNTVISPGRYS